MGHEKKEIQEIEQIPQPPEKGKIIEERQIIDNYEYHETKNIKKKKNPRVQSITHHERLSTPFERTVAKDYAGKNSTTQPKILSTTTVEKKNIILNMVVKLHIIHSPQGQIEIKQLLHRINMKHINQLRILNLIVK